MNVGELFVDLGIKGADKTLGSIAGAQKGMKGIASTSLEAKAAIVGAMYALERLFASSSQKGTDLTNFSSGIGESAKTLQQYQYAAQQVGVANDEVTSSFIALQKSSTNLLNNGESISGLARVAQVTKTSGTEMQKLMFESTKGNIAPLFQKLQEYSHLEQNPGLRNKNIESFGVSSKIITAMTRNAFRPDVLNSAPTYSDKQLKNLDEANVAWSNIFTKIEMAVGKFNALHGVDLVKEITPLVDKVLDLAEAFIDLADSLKLFEAIGKAIEISTAVVKQVTEMSDAAAGKNKQGKSALEIFGDHSIIWQSLKAIVDGVKTSGAAIDNVTGPAPTVPSVLRQGTTPNGTAPIPPQGSNGTQNNTINQTFTFQQQEDKFRQLAAVSKKSITDALRQSFAQVQVA